MVLGADLRSGGGRGKQQRRTRRHWNLLGALEEGTEVDQSAHDRISGVKRTATVVATSDMSLEVLNRREFMSLLDESSSLGRKILIGAVKRLQMNERPRTN